MTPQTKIGLLLSLAFLIVVGILLSEQVTQSTQAPLTTLSDAGNGVAASNRTPADIIRTPAEVVRRDDPVVRTADVELPAPHESIPSPVDVVPVDMVPTPQQIELAESGRPINTVMANAESSRAFVQSIEGIAREAGEEVVVVTPVQEKPAGRSYTAQPGDSLGKIARTHLGADNTANRNAIIALNHTLQKNPDLVVAGREYTLPASAAPSPAPAPPAPAPVREVTASSPRKYTVQANDSLWVIAQREVGNAGAIDTIKELNKLNGDVIHPGMTLVLPAKR